MTDPNPRAQIETEERASLYVLDLLDATERQCFEQRLRRDADLRGLVRGLEATLESEVFAEPAPVAPARVWGKILERTRMDGAQVLVFPESVRRWAVRLSAMAACLVLGALLQAWWTSGGGTAVVRRGSVESPGAGGEGGASADRSVAGAVPAPNAENPVSGPQGGAVSNAQASPAPDALGGPEAGLRDEALESENAALQGKIRGLNARIAELSQQVQQMALIPSGVSRIHVFPLGLPGVAATLPPGTLDGAGRTNSLAESLARLAGERMALALNPPSIPGQPPEVAALRQPGAAGAAQGLPPGVDPVAKVSLVPAQPVAPDSPAAPTLSAIPGIASVAGGDAAIGRFGAPGVQGAPSAGAPGVNLAPIVFSAPDSGVHAVAVPTAPPGGQYQLWNRGTDGTISSLGVLTPSGSPVSVVTFERGSVEGIFMSLEPVGGSVQPSGPVVGGSQNPVLPGLGKP